MEFKNILDQITKENGSFNQKARYKYVLKYFSEFYEAVIGYTKDLFFEELDPSKVFSQKLYHYQHKISNIILCEVCNKNKVAFMSPNTGYRRTCSAKCNQAHPETIKKKEQTLMNNYGVSNPSQSKEIQNTIKKNNLKKYNVTNTAKLQEKKDKTKKTNQKRYGSDTPAQNKEVMNKIIKTNKERHGVAYTFSSEEVKKKIVETSLKKYGFPNPAQNEEIKNRTRLTQKAKDFENYKKKYPSFNIKDSDSNILTVECCNGHDYVIPAYIFRQRIIYYKIDNPCIICNPIKSGSIGEKELIDYISLLGVECILNDREQIGLELDCYIPSKNIAFEYNGVYWHSDKFKHKNYHIDKKKLSHSKGINLVHVWEDDWRDRKHIVKSRINNLLGNNAESIYARKCNIVKIEDYSVYKEFMEDNHIQGSVSSKIIYALVYVNEIVSMMSFGSGRRSTGNNKEEGVYEMLRFCNKINTNVIVGASKLFKHFIKDFDPKSVFSYASLCWSSLESNVYEKLGFKYSKTTVPNYWYVKNGVRYHRFSFNKSILLSKGMGTEDMTESEIMSDLGYEKCYDTGSNLYVFDNR